MKTYTSEVLVWEFLKKETFDQKGKDTDKIQNHYDI